MHITLDAESLTKVRFQISPLWETVASLRALRNDTPLHRPWAVWARQHIAESPDPLARTHLRLLTVLILSRGYIVDSLTPTPERQNTFAESLQALLAVPREFWRRDLEHLAGIAEGDALRIVESLLADVENGVPRIATALQWYWETAVEPYWARLRSVLVADIDSRLEQLARDGIQAVFKSLHPSVRPTPSGLEVLRGCSASDIPEPGGGLILIPNAFVWPDTLVLNVRPFVPTLTYAPRGVARLWESVRETTESPVSALLGRTRAQILSQLDVPMTTTQLACALDLAAGTVNGHLKVLTGSGLASSMRSGREVFYQRAKLGEALLSSS